MKPKLSVKALILQWKMTFLKAVQSLLKTTNKLMYKIVLKMFYIPPRSSVNIRTSLTTAIKHLCWRSFTGQNSLMNKRFSTNQQINK